MLPGYIYTYIYKHERASILKTQSRENVCFVYGLIKSLKIYSTRPCEIIYVQKEAHSAIQKIYTVLQIASLKLNMNNFVCLSLTHNSFLQ